MLRLLRRCKSLVSLLLLFGCFLSFSSVSFAQDFTSNSSVNPFKASDYGFPSFDDVTLYSSSTFGSPVLVNRFSRLYDGGSNLASRTWVTEIYEGSGSVSLSYRSTSDDFVKANFVIRFPLSVSAFSSYPLIQDISISSAQLQGLTFTDFDSLYPVFQNGDLVIRFDGILANTNTSAGSVLASLGSLSFDYIIKLDYHVESINYATYSSASVILDASYPALTIDSMSLVDSNPLTPPTQGESQIDSSINSQTQQQQQQHEEQMEQSQQQYDDFTDSGSSDGSDLIAGTEEDIKEKIGIFTFLDNLIQRFLGLFVSSDASTSITLPAFSMNIQGRDYQIWEEYTFDLSSLDGPFNALMTAVRFATVATVYFAFLGYLQKTYKRIIGGSNG